ncbi:hypothetical protein DPMN_061880 [Dreissena polymorpha]|uniref:Uncharacterized protein n=1 Tax=Dreissena polymorpha TaxID=45954 RepID=A0A9D4C7U1_DREPO|nr:hypothetical protein DPMN_061880 [Dreissena polymorpha]
MADIVVRERRKKRTVKKTGKMQFVKEGETVKKQQTPAASILDLKRRLVSQVWSRQHNTPTW